MIKALNYVGIDISKLTFDVALEYESGKYVHYKWDNDLSGFKKLSKVIKSGNYCCVMEASGPYYLQLACYLTGNNIAVSVINPLVIRRFSQMRLLRAKTDKKDAATIAAYGKMEEPTLWKPEATYVLELKQMQALMDQLSKSRAGLLRQKEAFAQNPVNSTTVNTGIRKMIAAIEAQMSVIETKMELLVKEYHQTLFEQIQSIPGIGKKTAMQLIVLSGGFSKFENAKQLSAYVGLSPRIFESGTSVKGRARICKMGMGRIRAMLYVCSWTAKKCNKSCRELFDRLVAKGKSKKLALIAVANKLLKQAFAIATKNQFYLETI